MNFDLARGGFYKTTNSDKPSQQIFSLIGLGITETAKDFVSEASNDLSNIGSSIGSYFSGDDAGNAVTGAIPNNPLENTVGNSVTVPGNSTDQTQEAELVRTINALDQFELPTADDASKAIQQFRDRRAHEYLNENKFAVRLRSLSNKQLVAFRASPEINESRNVNYKTIDPLHMPGSIKVYTNTSSRVWSIGNIQLVSRNGIEAEENLATVNQLRSWMMPFFGNSTTADGEDNYTADMLGAPPEVLTFTAYSDEERQNGLTNIRNVPVVIQSLNIPYPNNVDYIKTATTNQPFPTVMSIDMTLHETHSPREFSEFNLVDYRHGNMKGF